MENIYIFTIIEAKVKLKNYHILEYYIFQSQNF